ncbi:mid1-interacting protein 1-B-like [Lepisosteus oculatus]|uniref:mid1-interacting protein 1-B-like n=1 Tax=Lepisosteus oculatus TaxID=7918 RepID=UPI0037222F3A
MQSADSKLTKSCLLVALNRYSSAVRNMEHTVMLPSLLRDVPAEEPDSNQPADAACKDLYEHYLMLKSVKNTVESGLMPLDEHAGKSRPSLGSPPEHLPDTDPETLFHYHLTGLFSVLSTLSQKSQTLTSRYKEIIGLSN